MNKTRSKLINAIYESIDNLYDELNVLLEEEQECYENMPESLKYTERADRMQDCIDNINSACASLEEAKDYLFDIADGNY